MKTGKSLGGCGRWAFTEAQLMRMQSASARCGTYLCIVMTKILATIVSVTMNNFHVMSNAVCTLLRLGLTGKCYQHNNHGRPPYELHEERHSCLDGD